MFMSRGALLPGLQFLRLEAALLGPGEKRAAVESLLQPEHSALAFLVCRDPVQKLRSVFRATPTEISITYSKAFLTCTNSCRQYFFKKLMLDCLNSMKVEQRRRQGRGFPSWVEFLHSVAAGDRTTSWAGLTDSLFLKAIFPNNH